MARSGGPAKPAKLTRADKKVARSAKRLKRRESWKNLRQAFTLTRQNDPRFVPYLVMSFVIAAALLYLLVFWITDSPYLPIAFAVMAGLFAAMFIFSRRAQHTMFRQAEGQPGAAGWMLQQQLRGDWRLTQAVAGTTQLDAVHRLVGRPGVVLVGEGAPHRVKGLLAQEKKRTARVVGETPIYDVIIGTGEGDLRLAKLNRYLLKLPANLSKEQVGTLEKRLAALGGGRAPAAAGADAAGRQDAQRAAHRPAPQLAPMTAAHQPQAPQAFRGQAIGLPESGTGSLAATGARLGAFVVDALASTLVAALFVHPHGSKQSWSDHLPGSWSLIPLAVDYLVGCLVAGGTLGMYLFGLRLIRVERPSTRVSAGQVLLRTFLLFLFVPAVVFDRDGRGMHDRFSDTAIVRA